MPRVFALVLCLFAASCAKPKAAVLPAYSGPPRAFKLISAAEEVETENRAETRRDLYVSTESGQPVPVVVATFETGPISLNGGRARLFGDEAGQEGWTVDNFLLLEILNSAGKVIDRAAIGFQGGTTAGAENVDAMGAMKFAFEAGEIDLTRKLPADAPFRIRATALDVGGVGRVSDVFLIVSGESGRTGEEENDLKIEW